MQGIIFDFGSFEKGFLEWLLKEKRITEKTAREYIIRTRKFFDLHNFSTIDEFTKALEHEGRPRNLVKALRNYIHYLYQYEYITEEEKDELLKILKLRPTNNADLYVPTDKEVHNWYDTVLNEDDERYKLIFELILFSGIRLSEAVEVLKNFDREKLHIIDDQYAYYELSWNRGHKRSNVVFMPVNVAKNLRRTNGITDKNASSWFRKSRNIRVKYLRKWFINKALEVGTPVNVVKFFVGHSLTRDVTSLHYIDMLAQAKRYYPRVCENIIRSLQQ